MNKCFPGLTSDNFVSHGNTTGSGEQKNKVQPGFKWGVRRNNGGKVKPKVVESLEKFEEVVKRENSGMRPERRFVGLFCKVFGSIVFVLPHTIDYCCNFVFDVVLESGANLGFF